MNWKDIVYDPGSTTRAFKVLSTDYKLEVLFSDFESDSFKRTIVISLDSVPVMVASSITNQESPIFLDILQNSQSIPIGVRLFAPDSGISRGEMKVTPVELYDIDDRFVVSYIQSLEIDKDLYYRESTFKHGTQLMQLKEYVLPGLKYIIDKKNASLSNT